MTNAEAVTSLSSCHYTAALQHHTVAYALPQTPRDKKPLGGRVLFTEPIKQTRPHKIKQH